MKLVTKWLAQAIIKEKIVLNTQIILYSFTHISKSNYKNCNSKLSHDFQV